MADFVPYRCEDVPDPEIEEVLEEQNERRRVCCVE